MLASGTPYTAPQRVYLIGNRLVAEYGEHNAVRLSPYFRLDLSVNYDIVKNERQEMGVNLSLYNATGHSNELYHRFAFSASGKAYAYRPVSFFLKTMPSFSFYHKF
ncbi:MAG: hypothetical protein IJ511_02045 [Bacteroides sp.]|nr:hypothetical protein [Bacteroides sp.]